MRVFHLNLFLNKRFKINFFIDITSRRQFQIRFLRVREVLWELRRHHWRHRQHQFIALSADCIQTCL